MFASQIVSGKSFTIFKHMYCSFIICIVSMACHYFYLQYFHVDIIVFEKNNCL